MIGWTLCDPFFGCQDRTEPYFQCSEQFCTIYADYKIIKPDGLDVTLSDPSYLILDMNDTAYLWHVIFRFGSDNRYANGPVEVQYKNEFGQWQTFKTLMTNLYGSVIIIFTPQDFPSIPSRNIECRTAVSFNGQLFEQKLFTVALNIPRKQTSIIKTSPVGDPARISTRGTNIVGRLLDEFGEPVPYRNIRYSYEGAYIGDLTTQADGGWVIPVQGVADAPDKHFLLEFVGDSLYYSSSLYFAVFVPCDEGTYRDLVTCPDGSTAYQNVCIDGRYITNPAQCACVPGETALPVVCSDGVTRHLYQCDGSGKWVYDADPCPFVCNNGDYHTAQCENGENITTEICQNNQFVPTGEVCPQKVCDAGAKKTPQICPDGSTIYLSICQNNQWVLTNEVCPTQVCSEGDVHMAECWDGSAIIAERCVGNQWLETGEVCPVQNCPEGTYRYPVICQDGSKIYEQKCVNNQWVLSDQVCAEYKPEPSELIKYLPYIALAGVGVVGLVLLTRK